MLPAPPSHPVSALVRPPDRPAEVYGINFWLIYTSNTAVMVAVSLLFRYYDFVRILGGAEWELGLIVGVGMSGALAMRLIQGFGMDHIGPKRVWLASLVTLTLSLLLHLSITSASSAPVYLVRILYMLSIAGAFGASLTYVSQLAPPRRMGEFIGMLGSSGFVGMATGPALGDWLVGMNPTRADVNRMFLVAAGMSLMALALVAVATRNAAPPRRRRRAPMSAVLSRFHPGSLLIVSATMGIGLSLPGAFVRPYASSLALDGIRYFFLTYAATAFAVRVLTRRLVDQVGHRPVVLAGMLCLAGSMLLYLLVRSTATLMIPAALAGVAHAFLFPAVMSGGNIAFPDRYRGLATTLMLAMFDIGTLAGQPLAGGVIRFAGTPEQPAYAAMFVTMAGMILGAIALYWIWPPNPARRRHLRKKRAVQRSGSERAIGVDPFEPQPLVANEAPASNNSTTAAFEQAASRDS